MVFIIKAKFPKRTDFELKSSKVIQTLSQLAFSGMLSDMKITAGAKQSSQSQSRRG